MSPLLVAPKPAICPTSLIPKPTRRYNGETPTTRSWRFLITPLCERNTRWIPARVRRRANYIASFVNRHAGALLPHGLYEQMDQFRVSGISRVCGPPSNTHPACLPRFADFSSGLLRGVSCSTQHARRHCGLVLHIVHCNTGERLLKGHRLCPHLSHLPPSNP